VFFTCDRLLFLSVGQCLGNKAIGVLCRTGKGASLVNRCPLGGFRCRAEPTFWRSLGRGRRYKLQLHLSQGTLKPLCLVPAETKNFSILEHGICYDVHCVDILQNEKKGMREGEREASGQSIGHPAS
jgi:hypothetical protein